MRILVSRLLCGLVGAFLGVSCHTAPEYAAPWAEYRLDGTVVSAEDDSPVKGIRVAFKETVALTDANGDWQIVRRDYPVCASPCSLEVTDPDGPENGGTFQAATVPLNLGEPRGGKGTWDMGTIELHGLVVRLGNAR